MPTSKTESKPQWAVQVVDRYKSASNLMKTFNPGMQSKFMTENLQRCFTGHAPSLTRVKVSFGEEIANNWLIIQITDLALFCGIKEKPDMAQVEAIARTIIANYGYLKLTELMVFFQRFKAGKHGTFYGNFDGITLNKALNDFLKYRREKLTEYERRVYL